MKKNKIVVFGGGTGLSRLLQGMKNKELEITVMVTISDNGGSTGKIRDYYNIPAPGDLRRAVLALSENDELEELMNYRFDDNIQHHTIGNLILTALTDIKGDMQSAVKSYCKLLDVKQNIIPISNQSLKLCAIMDSKIEIQGETQIAKHPDGIEKLFYKGDPLLNPEVLKYIKEADAIIFSSGSLYTSIISNLIFEELTNAINRSSAKKIYVANLMTERGETENYHLKDHVDAINKHLINSKIDYVIANDNFDIPLEIIRKYQKESAYLVKIDEVENNFKLITGNYLSVDNNYIRHDTEKIANEIISILKS